MVEIISDLQRTGQVQDANTSGSAVSFVCGSGVTFELEIDQQSKRILDARFSTNGCGFMTAAAELAADRLKNALLSRLGGIDDDFVSGIFRDAIGTEPSDRRQCLAAVNYAIRKALTKYRNSLISEFSGESALLCTCFGLSEEAIVKLVQELEMNDLETLLTVSNAGNGCGSCRLLLQEIIDNRSVI